MKKTDLGKVRTSIATPANIVPQSGGTLNRLLAVESVKHRFEEILGKKAPGFISSILSATQANQYLAACDPMSVISSAVIAASLDLPINSSLGFAHLVPYSGKCQFQLGWRGFVQLAARTGQYKTLNVTEVYEGEVKSSNRFTGFMEFDEEGKKSNQVIGYVAYLEMKNGFQKWCYMTRAQMEAHGKRYSKSYETPTGKWKSDFDAMAKKTVIKMLLSKWGMMSVDIQRAIDYDQAVVAEDSSIVYSDAPVNEAIDVPNAIPAPSSESAPSKPTEEKKQPGLAGGLPEEEAPF